MARLLRRQTPQLTVSLAFIHACAVQRFLQTWYSAASLIDSNTYVRILQGTQRLFRAGYQACSTKPIKSNGTHKRKHNR